MLDNRKLLALAITVSIIGVLALYFYASAITPKEMKIADVGDDDIGSLVTVNGTIRKAKLMDDGSASYEIIDLKTNASIVAYFNADAYGSWTSSEAWPVPGTMIQVTGTVEKYQEVYEIVVDSASDLLIVSYASENTQPIWLLLSSPEQFDGMMVQTNGTIREPYLFDEGIGFELAESHDGRSYFLSCVCFDDEILEDYDIGDELAVMGTFQYYEATGSWQVVIDGEKNMVLTQP